MTDCKNEKKTLLKKLNLYDDIKTEPTKFMWKTIRDSLTTKVVKRKAKLCRV